MMTLLIWLIISILCYISKSPRFLTLLLSWHIKIRESTESMLMECSIASTWVMLTCSNKLGKHLVQTKRFISLLVFANNLTLRSSRVQSVINSGPTIQSEFERFELVKACKWVDEVVEGPWIIDESKNQFMKNSSQIMILIMLLMTMSHTSLLELRMRMPYQRSWGNSLPLNEPKEYRHQIWLQESLQTETDTSPEIWREEHQGNNWTSVWLNTLYSKWEQHSAPIDQP